jgi:hypothetical protein
VSAMVENEPLSGLGVTTAHFSTVTDSSWQSRVLEVIRVFYARKNGMARMLTQRHELECLFEGWIGPAAFVGLMPGFGNSVLR